MTRPRLTVSFTNQNPIDTVRGCQRPASPMAWSFLFDIVHHRGQITTYLRPMGSTVPQIYGPSGDEP